MQLVVQGGLYEVVPGLYQVRTLDLSNITIAEGDDGIVVFDPLISTETARAALELYYAHRPRKPVVALVYSHSHVDHYGGVRGHRRRGRRRAPGKVKIVAPVGFLEAAVAENVLAGNVMSRRVELHVRQPAAGRPQGPGRRRARRDAPRRARSA